MWAHAASVAAGEIDGPVAALWAGGLACAGGRAAAGVWRGSTWVDGGGGVAVGVEVCGGAGDEAAGEVPCGVGGWAVGWLSREFFGAGDGDGGDECGPDLDVEADGFDGGLEDHVGGGGAWGDESSFSDSFGVEDDDLGEV